MRVLKTKELIENARKAYSEKRLSAQQQHNLLGSGCLYHVNIDGKNCGCAIGVSLNAEEIAKINQLDLNIYPVHHLINQQVVDFEDMRTADWLQSVHDDWANSVFHNADDAAYCSTMEQNFLDILDNLEKKATTTT